ncbi:MAG: PIN domain-containing protein [Pseudomonadota bacterium]|nr:PIN domain-containing protein [Pseudomonadota bacterium]
MKVFLDTNVFCKNWFVSNANFSLLFYFLNNEKFDLLLSKLVVQETNNIRERELKEIKSELERLVKKGNKLNQDALKFSVEELGVKEYDLSEVLKNKVDWIEDISYDNISHDEVVRRALKSTKPFSGQEKGYRDTLIWLSFIQHLKDKNIEGDVAFITNNKHDFFEVKSKTIAFNDDLKNDIASYGIKANIKPYSNVYDFVNENIDKVSHSFDRYEILDELEYFLEEEVESYLNSMSNYDISDLLGSRLFSEKLTDVVQIESSIFEGLEDPEVKTVKRLADNSVYISSYFEMRRVDLIITIDIIEYKQHADEIESIKALYNIELYDDYAVLSFILRTCIDGSFEYDTVEKEAFNLSIDYIYDSIAAKKS